MGLSAHSENYLYFNDNIEKESVQKFMFTKKIMAEVNIMRTFDYKARLLYCRYFVWRTVCACQLDGQEFPTQQCLSLVGSVDDLSRWSYSRDRRLCKNVIYV